MCVTWAEYQYLSGYFRIIARSCRIYYSKELLPEIYTRIVKTFCEIWTYIRIVGNANFFFDDISIVITCVLSLLCFSYISVYSLKSKVLAKKYLIKNLYLWNIGIYIFFCFPCDKYIIKIIFIIQYHQISQIDISV